MRGKIKFIFWLITSALAIIYFISLIINGFPLNTNVLSLLPKSNQNPVIEKAVDQFSQRMGNQVIFLIGNQNKKSAQDAADIFYQHINQSNLFDKLTYEVNNNEQQAWGAFYFPYRLSLLTPKQRSELAENNIKAIEQSALFNLYNPMGITNSDLLKSDPYFLFTQYVTSIPKPASNVQLIDNNMMIHNHNKWYVMLNAQLKGDSFSISNQNAVVTAIQQAKALADKIYPDTSLVDTGMLFYAKAGADDAQHDISTIGIGSIVGIILLILITFRSLLPLCFILFSSVIGFICAFVTTYLIFGSVYLFTLIFGASLIGISVDYAFFYYSEQLLGGKNWQPQLGLKNIFSGITLGLVNIIIAYIIIAFTPFPGLQQLAIFAIIGLGMAYATVVCFFPLVLKAKKKSFTPPILNLTNLFLSFWQRVSRKVIFCIYIILFIIIAIGIMQIKADDNIRILQSVPAQLKQNEKDIKAIIGSDISTNFILISGNSPQEVLEIENTLTSKIILANPKVDHPYLAINSYIPTIKEQQENYNLVQKKLIQNNLSSYLHQIGMHKNEAENIKSKLSQIVFKPLTIEDWLQSPVSNSLRFLWLGKVNNQYVTVLLPSNKIEPHELTNLTQQIPGTAYINKADDISKVFHTYRIKLSLLLVIAFVALFILLFVRYRFKKACLYILPPIFASLLSLATIGWLHIPLTLFSILALILVLGIAVDYVLFFSETKSKFSSTMLATSLSAITTILSFGLLALSSTPAIEYFGLTVLIGIGSAFLLSPIVMKLRVNENDK